MENSKTIEITKKMIDIIGKMPDTLNVGYMWLDTITPYGERPEITIYESIQTRPDGFYELSDRLGLPVLRTDRDEENDDLTMDADGICLLMIVEKEANDD